MPHNPVDMVDRWRDNGHKVAGINCWLKLKRHHYPSAGFRDTRRNKCYLICANCGHRSYPRFLQDAPPYKAPPHL